MVVVETDGDEEVAVVAKRQLRHDESLVLVCVFSFNYMSISFSINTMMFFSINTMIFFSINNMIFFSVYSPPLTCDTPRWWNPSSVARLSRHVLSHTCMDGRFPN